MSILFFCLIFPRPPLHTAPLEFSQGCSVEGGVPGRREPDTECRRVWNAAGLVAVVPRRVGAVPGSAGFSIPLYFFFLWYVTYFDSALA